ncbi:hypothetical protein [Nonomuraea sp. NPDC003201]
MLEDHKDRCQQAVQFGHDGGGLQCRGEGRPTWQKPVTGMKRRDPGALRENSRFRWTTPVPATPVSPPTTLVITSTVRQLQRHKCIRWTGPAIGEGLRIDRGVHVWTFAQVKGGVLVTGRGDPCRGPDRPAPAAAADAGRPGAPRLRAGAAHRGW